MKSGYKEHQGSLKGKIVKEQATAWGHEVYGMLIGEGDMGEWAHLFGLNRWLVGSLADGLTSFMLPAWVTAQLKTKWDIPGQSRLWAPPKG